MPADPLSEVLRTLHLRGGVFYYVSCADEWVAETPGGSRLAATVLPGAEHVAGYHLVLRGGCWAATDGEPPIRVGAGDLVMFPRSDVHVLSSAPGLRAPPDPPDWREQVRSSPRPVSVALRHGGLEIGAALPAEDASAVIVCGFVGCDLTPWNPVVASLPRILHLPASTVGSWVQPMLGEAVAESLHRRPGSGALLERISEMVFVDAVRRYLEGLPEGEGSGFLPALRDRNVGRALSLLHGDPSRSWSIEDLARAAGLSRSILHERFHALLGEAPMQYLTRWRVQLAALRLREGDETVARIAQEVGYESEAAFARAFKRAVGEPPATYRRSRRASA